MRVAGARGSRADADSAHVDHVARLDRVLQPLPALAEARGALGWRRELRARKLGAQLIEHHRPLRQTLGETAAAREYDWSLDRHVSATPLAGTSPATAWTAAIRSYSALCGLVKVKRCGPSMTVHSAI